ncbi:MAG TPA: thymidine phosphorylase [Candidatus Acidoferrales bacterium]|nr:thymidine phosphorylase [Candidatus Acidoferrales bacterium]
MNVGELIRKKRDGGALTNQEISFFVQQHTAGNVPEYQTAALLMAVYFQGMTAEETAALTEAMMRSGEVLDFSELPAKKVDKHSTGGVGDKTSLVLAPAVAAAGLIVPMISGRGLGHTGGTLDKLEAIPGFNVNLSLQEFRAALREVGCALIGQTKEIAPADKEFYALRDVTGTIPSIPLITSSILSKKLAEGIDALVLDVKVGSGAFMKELEDATKLAVSMRGIGTLMGKKVVALLTNMDQPLGSAAGNALETAEAIETLQGGGPEDFRDLCRELASWMLVLGEKAERIEEGRGLYDELIESGAAAKKFREIIARQGGDPAVMDDLKRLPQARATEEFKAAESGYIASIQTERLGWAGMALGAGRERVDQAVDPAVGMMIHKKVGDAVRAGEPLVTLHFNQAEKLPDARRWLEGAFQVGAARVEPRPLVLKTLN